MKLNGPAVRATVFVGDDETWRHKRIFTEIVHRAHTQGLAGVSVLAGIEGFGIGRLIHTDRFLSLCENLPVAVIIIDTEDHVRGFLPQLADLVTDDRVILSRCEAIRYIRQDQSSDT